MGMIKPQNPTMMKKSSTTTCTTAKLILLHEQSLDQLKSLYLSVKTYDEMTRISYAIDQQEALIHALRDLVDSSG